MPNDEDFCGHIVDATFAKRCSDKQDLWDIWYRVGTGKVLVKDPFVRCSRHVIDIVSVLAKMQYDTGYLDAVVPRGTKIDRRVKDKMA